MDSRAVEAIVASGKAEKSQRSCSATVESVKLISYKKEMVVNRCNLRYVDIDGASLWSCGSEPR